jgi:hypothetical protein
VGRGGRLWDGDAVGRGGRLWDAEAVGRGGRLWDAVVDGEAVGRGGRLWVAEAVGRGGRLNEGSTDGEPVGRGRSGAVAAWATPAAAMPSPPSPATIATTTERRSLMGVMNHSCGRRAPEAGTRSETISAGSARLDPRH